MRECWIYTSENILYFPLNILCQQWCKNHVSKSAATANGFTTENEHLIKRLWVSKNSVAKRLLKMLFDRRWRLGRLNILIYQISARSLTLLIFAIGWAVFGRRQPGHESMMPVLSFLMLINVRSLTLLIFAIGWAVCGRRQPGHESMMPVLSFSLLSF